jgi:hypothetical protein
VAAKARLRKNPSKYLNSGPCRNTGHGEPYPFPLPEPGLPLGFPFDLKKLEEIMGRGILLWLFFGH